MAVATGMYHLPLELYGIIASHIPLPARPLAPRSLALTNSQISEIIIPSLLYQHIIIHKEENLISIIDLLCREAQFRAVLRGIYIRAFLSSGQDGEYPAMTKLTGLFSSGWLSGMHTIDLRLGSYKDGKPTLLTSSNPFEALGEGFWMTLNESCPNLRTLTFDHHGARYPAAQDRNLFPWNRETSLSHFKVRNNHYIECLHSQHPFAEYH